MWNKTRLIMAMLCLIFLIPAGVFGEESQNEQELKISVTFSSSFWSEYTLTEGVIHDRPVFQNDLFIALPHGFFVDVWWSMGIDGTGLNSDYGDELDYTLGWGGDFEGFTLTTSLSYFDFYDIGSSEGGDVMAGFFKISREWPNLRKGHSLTPYINASIYFPYNWDVSSGVESNLGMRHTYQITPWLDVNNDIFLVYDSGTFDADTGFILGHQFDLGWRLSDNVTLSFPMIKSYLPLRSFYDERERSTVFGTALTVNFDLPFFNR